MRNLLVLVAIIASMYCWPAFSAGPFDGQWTGNAVSSCGDKEYDVTMSIRDNVVTGAAGTIVTETAADTGPVSGTVAGDGTFAGLVGSHKVAGQFASTTFNGSYSYMNGEGTHGVKKYKKTYGTVCTRTVKLTRTS